MPAQVGELETILKISAILIAIAGLRYEMAIIVEDDDEKAQNLTRLSLISNFTFSCLAFVGILIFGDYLGRLLDFKNLNLLFFVPLIVWLSGSAETLIIWRNRAKKYSKISTNRIASSASSASYKIAHPYLSVFSTNGLVLGHIIGQAVALTHIAWKLPFQVLSFTKEKLVEVARLYKTFPLYSMPGAVLNIFATSLPIFVIGHYAGQDATGHFAYAYKLSYLPLSMLAMAMGQVYFEKLSRSKNDKKKSRKLSQELLLFLFTLVIIPCISLFFYGEEIATFFLGEQWGDAGIYIENTILFYTAMFITNPFFCTFDVYKKLKQELLFNLVFMLLSGAAMILAYEFYDSTVIALQWFSVIGILLRVGILQYFFKLTGKYQLTIWLLITSLGGVLYYILNFLT